MDMDRRTLIGVGLAAAGAAAAGGAARSQTDPASAPAAEFAPKPLPFDPAGVPGLSERLLRSHYDNNYGGAVRRLSAINAQLAAQDFSASPSFVLNGLKREELIAWNSMILHEVYFGSLGGEAQVGADLGAAIERDFGSHERWASEFSNVGKALGGGSGWVLLTWSARDQRLVNSWAADHTMTLAAGTPLLALDMYEHAYHMDYGAAAADYVDAFMAAMTWDNANAAFDALQAS